MYGLIAKYGFGESELTKNWTKYYPPDMVTNIIKRNLELVECEIGRIKQEWLKKYFKRNHRKMFKAWWLEDVQNELEELKLKMWRQKANNSEGRLSDLETGVKGQ
jgi:hypothetical protein